MGKPILSLLMIVALSGCATVSVVESSRIEEAIGRTPELSSDASAPVGGTIFSQYRYWRKVGYRLNEDVSIGLRLGQIVARVGDFLAKATIESETAYCTETRSYIDPLTGPLTTACFLDRDNDGAFEAVKAAPGVVWFENPLVTTVKYQKGELIVPRRDATKYELLYQGFSKGALRLSYREYINDLARPSYFQDVAYDISSFPTDLTFKSVRLKVLGADNNSIRYKVLSGFQ